IRKTCVFSLILLMINLPFPGRAQPISLKKRNITLANLFVELNKLSGYDFVYDFGLVENAGRININVREETLQSVLDDVLEEKNLSYTITGNIVTITTRQPQDRQVTAPQQRQVSGQVTDQNSNPLSG